MKAADNFIFKQMRDTGMIIPVGERSFDFRGMVTLNETGSFLWQKLAGETTRDELVSALLAEYDVDEARAAADVDAFLDKLSEAGLLDR